MKLKFQDYALTMTSLRLAPLLRRFGELESYFAVSDSAIDRPIFVAGLARSGTTLLLELLSRAQGVATHRYRDFPFLWIPLVWNWFQERFGRAGAPVERAQADRVFVSRESPEAFEEPIWQHYFPWIHDSRRTHVLDSSTRSPEFEEFFRDHIRKVLKLRSGTRYVSKGNYNVVRIEYLARLFRDALFLVPVREPIAHVHSLVQQHDLFTSYVADDGRIAPYLEAAGHYEFGPQRVPIHVSASASDRILGAWRRGDDYLGYALLWSEVYGYVARILEEDAPLRARVLVVPYEQLCDRPAEQVRRILDFVQLSDEDGSVSAAAKDVRPLTEAPTLPESAGECVRAETASVASRFGYAA